MTVKLSIKGLAIGVAIFWGAYLFLLGLLSSFGVNTIWFSKGIVDMAAIIYPGFAATIGGAFIGLIYGIICGAICGGIFGWLYNKFA